MKKVIIVYNTAQEYSSAYKKYKDDGFDVSVVVGIEFAISIKGRKMYSLFKNA